MRTKCLLGKRELQVLLGSNIRILKEIFEKESKQVLHDANSSILTENINFLIAGIFFKFYGGRSISNLKRTLETNNIYNLMSAEELFCLNEQIEKIIKYTNEEASNLYEDITALYDDYNIAFRDYGNNIGKHAKEEFYKLIKKIPLTFIKDNRIERKLPDTKVLKDVYCDDKFYNNVMKSIDERLKKVFTSDKESQYSIYGDSELSKYNKSYLKVLSQKGITLFNSESISGELLGKLYLGFYGHRSGEIIEKVNKSTGKKVTSVMNAQDNITSSYLMVMLSITRDMLDSKEKQLCNEGRYGLSESEKVDLLIKAQQIGVLTKEVFKKEYVVDPIDYIAGVNETSRSGNMVRVQKKTE